MMQAFLCLSIRTYKRFVSPILSRWYCCRFHPTCSEYAMLSIQKHGVLVGVRMSAKRLTRCRPDNFDSCIDYP